ncbi:hypothetical protein DFR68_12285 [Nocardia mexicana]|uniref:Uncharacterized protein n=2 Tax=Nocardia mexicana TaxID=279262 RepID=A0A370GHR7_9NOCA|nr:hypothetical protein DFR68_12285 [Nocardia mexicana]
MWASGDRAPGAEERIRTVTRRMVQRQSEEVGVTDTKDTLPETIGDDAILWPDPSPLSMWWETVMRGRDVDATPPQRPHDDIPVTDPGVKHP